jgi:predicted transcriptional regulator
MAAREFQTIVKLKNTSADVRSQAMIEQLARIAGARVDYVRPMSGDAHVVRVVPTPPTTYEQALQRLRDSGLIDYVEHDALMQPMSGR